jgi:hypothetical protein
MWLNPRMLIPRTSLHHPDGAHALRTGLRSVLAEAMRQHGDDPNLPEVVAAAIYSAVVEAEVEVDPSVGHRVAALLGSGQVQEREAE